MNKLLVLVACSLCTVSAGRILQQDWQPQNDRADGRLENMSRQDVVRQKFLLDIVQRVQQPLLQEELIELDQGLIVDPTYYRGGIDAEMQRVIDLDRQRRLLDEHQECSLRNVEHVQQLRGIYRLLMRAIDFETLQRNVVYLRRNINPVLFVNALTLAIRDREDTQSLIMPALEEILPEFYFDEQTIGRVQRMQQQLEQSGRPSFMDLVGVRDRMRAAHPLMKMFMPWRDIKTQLTTKRQETRVIIRMPTRDEDMSLLTEDIGMHRFVQSLLQELALLEDISVGGRSRLMETEYNNGIRRSQDEPQNLEDAMLRNVEENSYNQSMMRTYSRRYQDQQEDIMNRNQRERFLDVMRRDSDDSQFRRQIPGQRVPLERNAGLHFGDTHDDSHFPTVDINSERLLHVGRRHQIPNFTAMDKAELEARIKSMKRADGMRTWRMQDDVSRMQDSMYDLPTARRDDERLVHINRRRMDKDNMNPLRVNRIGEGRRVGRMDARTAEDIMHLIRRDNRLTELSDEEIVEMLQRNSMEEGHRYPRSLNSMEDVDELMPRRGEALLQTLRQLLARLNQERISLHQVADDEQLSPMEYDRNPIPNEKQAQRYALRLNEMRMESRRNRILIGRITAVEERLQQGIDQVIRERSLRRTDSMDVQLRMERMMGDVLIGRMGNMGILRILREQLQDLNNEQENPLGYRILLYTLRRIINIVDEQREQQLGTYNRSQLELPEVTINDIRVSKLRTRIEDGDKDVSSMLEQPKDYRIFVRQRRLNSLPFTIDMDIRSQVKQNVIIRLMMGPRQERSLEESRRDFMLLDAVETQLEAGVNRIRRSSTEIGWTTPDATPYSEIYRRVMSAMDGEMSQMLTTALVGENGRFPQRLLLPRGRPEGLPMRLLVIVSPVEHGQSMSRQPISSVMGITRATLADQRPLGYPLDRRIDNEEQLLRLSNVQLQDVLIVQEN